MPLVDGDGCGEDVVWREDVSAWVAFQSERLTFQCERVIGILWGGAFVFNVNIVRAREKVGRATSPLAVESGLQQMSNM